MNIMIVDDEKKFVTMLAKRLKFRGINPDIALNGAEALKLVAQKDYDAAVLDIKMPGMSGTALRKELSAIQDDLKFIFVTGHGGVRKAEGGGQDEDIYLSKPLNIDVLIETLEKIVN